MFHRCEVCGCRVMKHALCSRHRPVRERVRQTSTEARARWNDKRRRIRAARCLPAAWGAV